jgi:apolipoprotein N-acyltransferase
MTGMATAPTPTQKTARAKVPSKLPAAPPAPGLAAELFRAVLLSGLSVGLFSMIFPSLGVWPLTFACLAPWAIAVCRTTRAWIAHWTTMLAGWTFFLVNLAWMIPVTGLGYTALALYLAFYWVLSAWAMRTGLRAGISPIWTLPVAWTACEYLRAWVMSGFPWFFLAHAMYGQIPLIQVSDLTGAYGVSFLAALLNGVLVELALHRWPAAGARRRPRQLVAGVAVCVLLPAAALGYGFWQLQRSSQFVTDGPRVAVVQGDFPLVNQPPYGAPPQVIFAHYMALAGAAAQEKPDLVAFPETTWGAYQNVEFLEVERRAVADISADSWSFGRICHDATAAVARGEYGKVNDLIESWERRLMRRAQQTGDEGWASKLPRLPASGPPVALVVGAQAIEIMPESTYPRFKRFNSALVYDADGVQRRERYDKRHLVPFGELVPFRNQKFLGFSLHWLYLSLNRLSPFSRGGSVEYSLWSGDAFTVFSLRSNHDQRFGVPICYEDVMPHVVRRYVWEDGRRRADFLINISNDGWFLHSAELPQHLAICVFRAVENRVGIARAVNTGCSGFIDPDGRLYGMVARDGRMLGPGIVGYSVQPVMTDRRGSFYGRRGDWFAGACLAAAAPLWLGALLTRWVLALQHRLRRLLVRGGA